MFFTLLALIVVVITTALAAFVGSRAWTYRPSRIFVYFAASIMFVTASTIVRDAAPSPEEAYGALGTLVVCVGFYIWLLMLLLSALFVPEWWERRRPIVWISLPYLLSIAVLLFDVVARTGLVVGPAASDAAGLYRLTYIPPGSLILLTLSLLGQVVNFVIVGVGLFRPQFRQQRPAIITLGLAMTISLGLAVFAGQFTAIARVATLVQTLPILAALGYMVLGTQLFVSTRAALDLALQSLGESVAVVDAEGKLTYANPQAVRLGLSAGEPLRGPAADLVDALGGAEELVRSVSYTGQTIELSATAVRDAQGQRRGTLLLGRDVSELTRRTAELEAEQARLAEALRRVEDEKREREQLAATVRSLSLPLIPVLPGVIVLPLIGEFTSDRIDEFVSVLLRGIERERADTVLLDITGISLLDTAGAQGLLVGVQSAALLGARCVLVGVRPEVAQSIVSLGLALDEVRTVQTLEQAVRERIAVRQFA